MYPAECFSDDQVRERLEKWFPKRREISEQTIARFRDQWSRKGRQAVLK
jgi:hypothetical protein